MGSEAHRPDGKPADYDEDPEYFDSEEYQASLNMTDEDLRLSLFGTEAK